MTNAQPSPASSTGFEGAEPARIAALTAETLSPPKGFFHGGAPGLRPGDLLTPRPPEDQRHLVDGCPVCEARRAGAPSNYDVNHNFARIYITTDRLNATGFANGYPLGAVYRVEPVGELTVDPEQPRNAAEPVNFAVEAARVLSVLDPLVRLTPKEVRHLMRRQGITWRDAQGALNAV